MDKLMIINSNDDLRNSLYDILCDSEFELYTAINGNEALLKISELMPDIVILYSDLNDMSGFDVCRKIKANSETKFIMVLLMLSIETNNYIKRALHSKADDYIAMNAPPTVLLAKLNSFLRLKQLNEKNHEQYLLLKEKEQLINFQLQTAQKVQRSIIRDIDTSIGSLHVVSKYLPALEIGGDFFNVKQIDDNHVGIIIGDVSGHGISAALLTSMLNMMFNSLFMKYKKPNELLHEMNSQFCSIFDGSDNQMYACVFYAVVDLGYNQIVYSNAGQSFPMYVSAEYMEARELELGGTPIGLLPSASYSNSFLEYKENDMLLFHTDGLSDMCYKEKPEEFNKKLKQVMIKCVEEDYPIHRSVSVILNEFYKFDEAKKYESDDVSMLLCKL